jgi:hypothetical protein
MKRFAYTWLVVSLLLFGLAQFSSVAAAAAPEKQDDSSRSDLAVPSGQALSEGEVIILLQAKVPLDTIEKFVAARGVNFVSTKETSKRILAAGGNVSLVGTINLNQKEDLVADPNAAMNGKGKKK